MKRINQNKKSKEVIIDILLIILIIISAICLHLPSYHYTNTDKKLINEYTDENNDTYLHDLDSYYYARKVKEFSSDKIITTKEADKLRGYSKSSDKGSVPFAFPALVSVIWKTVSLFSKKLPFIRFIRFMGPFLSALACIPAYIFVKKRTNILGGLTAGFTAAISPAFFGSNGFGCFDTDLLLYLLPLAFMCLFIESLQEKKFKKQLIWIGVLSLVYIFLSYTWVSHIIYYYLAVGLSLLFIFITLIKEKFKFKKCLEYSEFRSSLITIILLTILTLLIDKTIDFSLFGFLFNMLKGKDIFSYDVYPDPGKYVSELGSIKLFSGGIALLLSGAESGIINKMGGIFIVLVAFITLIYFFKNGFKYLTKSSLESKNNYILFLVLTLWLIGGLICLKAGLRFTKISAVPLSLIVGMGIGIFYKYLSKNHLELASVFISSAFIFFIPAVCAIQQAKYQEPSVNDALSDISDWINKNTKENAAIISWWDYGYYYQYRANRMTVSDGGTFDGRFYYWLSNIFITNDEKLSSGISKMLAYRGTKASALADKYLNSSKKGCQMLKEILILNKEEASKLLKNKYHLNAKQIKKLLKYSHPTEEREIIIVVTRDMLNKIKPISYYANYDFTDKDYGVSSVDSDFMMYKFYHNIDIKTNFKYLKSISDPTSLYDGIIWKVIK